MEILELIGVPYFKKGKGIHIKKKNRGKFTEYCGGKVTQKCIDKAKKSKNPTLRKRATFADNSRKWKHQEGGILSKYRLIQKNQEGAKFPAFYINFNGRPAKAESKLKSKINSALRTINADATHAGFMYITPDGTPVFKEYGIKNGNSYWGNRVDLSEAPKYQQGQDPQQYFLSIYKYLNPISGGGKSEVILIPNTDSQKIENYINSVDDTQYNLYGCNGQTCGSVAYRALSHGIGSDGSKPRGLQTLWSYIMPDGEENGQVLQHSGNYPTFTAREIDEQKEEELRNRSLTNTRNRTETQFDFSNLQDKKWYMPISLLQKDGHTCIYNGTQCVYPEHTLAQNETLVSEPEKHGWREIPQSEVKPGDAIILTNSQGEPKHFTTFDGVVPEGTKPYYYMNDESRTDNAKGKRPRMVQPGDTLLNYSPGTPRNKTWRTHAPLFRFDPQYNTAGGDFSGPRRYFRPTGKFEND